MIGPLLAGLSAALLVIFIVVWQVAIKQVAMGDRRGLINGIIWAGMCLAAASLVEGAGTLGSFLAGTTLVVGGFYTFLFLIAGQSKQAPGIAVGDAFPALRAPDENGEVFELASLRGEPVLIKLFRGHW